MDRIITLMILTTLLTPPCAVFAGQAGAGSDSAVLQRYLEKLPAGADVKVRMRSGEKFRATLLGVQNDRVVLQPRTRVPEPQRLVPIADVEMIEPRSGGINPATAVAIGIGSGLASFAGLLLMVLSLSE